MAVRSATYVKIESRGPEVDTQYARRGGLVSAMRHRRTSESACRIPEIRHQSSGLMDRLSTQCFGFDAKQRT